MAAITPWNYPLYTTLAKDGPALAAGNTVILKPAPQSPWYATLIAEVVVRETDLQPGVLNILPTSDNSLAERLSTDPRVDMVHFTGSTAVDRTIMRNAASHIGRVSLERGGRSANIILDDAPLTDLVPLAAGMVCINAGQGRVLPTRLLVPIDRWDEAVELATFAYQNIPVGDPRDPVAVQGPQVSAVQQHCVLDYIRRGRDDGATVLVGGNRPAGMSTGYFVEPTLFADVDPYSTIAQDEIFGPVLCLIPHRGDDDAIRIANCTPYGLAGSIWSADTTAR